MREEIIGRPGFLDLPDHLRRLSEIGYAVWLYFRFLFSLGVVEEMPAACAAA